MDGLLQITIAGSLSFSFVSLYVAVHSSLQSYVYIEYTIQYCQLFHNSDETQMTAKFHSCIYFIEKCTHDIYLLSDYNDAHHRKFYHHVIKDRDLSYRPTVYVRLVCERDQRSYVYTHMQHTLY